MTVNRKDAHSWSSETIFKALSRSPLEVESAYSVQAHKDTCSLDFDTIAGPMIPHPITRTRVVQKHSLDSNGRHVIDLRVPSAMGASASPARLVLTGTTQFPTPKTCIRTIELSLDPASSPSPEGKTILANGYQSWSTSYAGADDTSVFEKPNWLYNETTHLGLASDMHIYEYPGVKGKVHSSLVTSIRDKCVDFSLSVSSSAVPIQADQGAARRIGRPEELVLCGSLSEDHGYTYFSMDTTQSKITISQDCVGKQLRKINDKLVLRTFFAWDNKDTTVWDAYAAAWASIHRDRRFIQSSLHNQLSGWTSWYYHYENISEHIILENLQHFSGSGSPRSDDNRDEGAVGWPAKVFQIDDGFTIVGDWLDPHKDKFPRGMRFIAKSIRDKGLTPGLWLAPFLASKKSKIVQEHPEWFVRKPTAKSYCISDSDNIEKKQRQARNQSLYCCCCHTFDYGNGSPTSDLMLAHPAFTDGAFALDLENPEVQAHLANIFKVVTQEWGFKMLKLDFLFAAAQVARNGKTHGQLMWEAMQMVRTWAGPDTTLLGCGVPLGASFMLVDYCRIGCDVGASWDTMQRHFHDREYISCFNSLTSTLSRWAMSGRFFGNDPDVYFIRDWNMGLSTTEKRTLMLLNHLLGHLVFCSDPFHTAHMKPEQQAILSSFFPWPSTPDVATPPHEVVRVLQPVPSQKDLYLIQVHAGKNKELTYIVATNLSSRKQQVHLSALERVIISENDSEDSTQGSPGSAMYFEARMGQFGSSAAAYVIKPRETCVFLRAVNAMGRLLGPCATLTRAGYGAATLEASHMETLVPVHLVATSGGHVLPLSEIESFQRDAKHQHQLTIRFRPRFFPKLVTVWLAWSKSATKSIGKDDGGGGTPLTLNGQLVQLRPEVLVGLGMCVASCEIALS
ncbi:hypothetical protein BGZ99_004093 [Dissophora globulifera]|uniref:alpha-galactosidase n=1 Tax=Dissophora globulifera TaxID=979702 RepID=A0A9P6RIW9_9FUNG|nr:hypothetical protein BGZ99_004093 [Dissophora globulifera]